MSRQQVGRACCGGRALLSHPVDGGWSASPGLPRAVEIPLVLAGLVVAAPVIAVAGAAIVLSSGLPVFFRQTRVGRHGAPFTLVKLRTMRLNRGGPRVTSRDDVRVTPIGRFLRRSKIDELPELWNVLRGDMALVGPRPEVPELVEVAEPLWRLVLSARPGLTDPVTVSLRDEEHLLAAVPGDRELFYRETLQPQKLQGYREYLSRRTWRSDLRVLWDTAIALLRPRRAAPTQPPDLSQRPPLA